jgi:DNA-binding MarR family transcriptional regulator
MTAKLPLDIELDETFRKMIRKFVVERDKVLINDEISPPQLVVLSKLYMEGPQKAGALSEALDFSPGATTALCDKLVDGGYVFRTRPDSDRRVMMLQLTDRGIQFIERLHGSKSDSRGILFQTFSEDEKRLMLDFCKRVVGQLHGYSDVLMKEFNEIYKDEIVHE